MRKCGLSVLCVLAGLVISACAGGSSGERSYGSGRDNVRAAAVSHPKVERVVIPGFESHFSPQLKDQWCWAACAQMVIGQQLGLRMSQEDLVRQHMGRVVNEPATADTITRSLAMTVGTGRSMRTMRAVYLDGMPAEDHLWADLQAGKPRVLAVALPGSRGREHVVVCYGAERTGIAPGLPGSGGGAGKRTRITRLYLYDPAPGRGAAVVGYDAMQSEVEGGPSRMGAIDRKTGKPMPRVTGSFRVVVVG
jgi:hypothetical protein